MLNIATYNLTVLPIVEWQRVTTAANKEQISKLNLAIQEVPGAVA